MVNFPTLCICNHDPDLHENGEFCTGCSCRKYSPNDKQKVILSVAISSITCQKFRNFVSLRHGYKKGALSFEEEMSKKKEENHGVRDRISDLLVSEVHNMSDEMKIVKVGIQLSNERMQVLEEICKIRGDELRHYVVDLDLETPNDLGLDYCKYLKKILSRKSIHGEKKKLRYL